MLTAFILLNRDVQVPRLERHFVDHSLAGDLRMVGASVPGRATTSNCQLGSGVLRCLGDLGILSTISVAPLCQLPRKQRAQRRLEGLPTLRQGEITQQRPHQDQTSVWQDIVSAFTEESVGALHF